MNTFYKENSGTDVYLVYGIPENAEVDRTAVGMLTENHVIPGLADHVVTHMNNDTFVKYQITSKRDVRSWLGPIVSRERLLTVLNGIADAMMAMEDYLLDYHMLVLDPGNIYISDAKKKIYMIYLPIIPEKGSQPDVAAFFKATFLDSDSIHFSKADNLSYVGELLNFFKSSHDFSLVDFKKKLTELSSKASDPNPEPTPEPGPHPEPAPTPGPVPIPIPPIPFPDPVPDPVPNPVPKPKPKPWPFGGNKHSDRQKARNTGEGFARPGFGEGFARPGFDEGFARPGFEEEFARPGFDNRGESAKPVYSGAGAGNIPVQIGGNTKPAADGAYRGGAHAEGGEAYSGDFNGNMAVYKDFASDSDSDTIVIEKGKPPVNVPQRAVPYLVRVRTNEKILLNKPEFLIGRESGEASSPEEGALRNDYVLDNMSVGRFHCHILVGEGGCFIVDDNSKNHTYVDDRMVVSGTETPLSHGQIITIADESFEFLMS